MNVGRLQQIVRLDYSGKNAKTWTKVMTAESDLTGSLKLLGYMAANTRE